ncbi:glycine cleavage system protein GcvH [Brasilonema octagenarum]|uniref:Glycine cleavage system H protein n=1 Tax=Brasilonema octagenarum UFV-OR1 TaxID=417115 RepID=A0ABX1MIX1_9CYAN|nr:glycine cleavage system protein GcvH [Brasilonema octagenarum]NMF67303.1 glycine cleavage system protein GcvH [Brasilonema octagenarum UFV-OR1]
MSSQPSRFAKTHEWVTVDGDIATVGITEFAVKLLSDLVFVDLPKIGKTVAQGDSFGEIESVKHVSDLYAPVSGTVTEVNKPLADNLEWLQQDPHAKAWMIKLKISNPAEVNALLDAAAYAAHCESESH